MKEYEWDYEMLHNIEVMMQDEAGNYKIQNTEAFMQKNYEKIREMYQDQETSASLGLVIGAVTESQQLIDHALRSEQEGGPMSMCNALEELRREGVLEGQREGRLEGIRATIRTCKKFNISEEDIIRNIMEEFSLSQEKASGYVKKY